MEHPPIQFESTEKVDAFKRKHETLHRVYLEFQAFETEATTAAITHIETIRGKLEELGINVDLLIYGSTAAGMALDTENKKSDVDVNIIYKTADEHNRHLANGFSAELFLNSLDTSEIKINVVDKPFKFIEIEEELNTLSHSDQSKIHGEIERFYLSYLQAGRVIGEESQQLVEKISEARKGNSGLDKSMEEIEQKFFPNLNFMGGNIGLDEHFKIYTKRLGNNLKFQSLSAEDQKAVLMRIETDIKQVI